MKIIILTILLSLGMLHSATADRDSGPPPGRPPELKQAIDVTLVTLASVEILKRAIKDPRPHSDGGVRGSGYGFPSGHSALAFGLARVASEYHPRQRTLWYTVAAGIAWSRVKRRAHDWDDVMGGALLGSWVGDTAIGSGGIVLKKWQW